MSKESTKKIAIEIWTEHVCHKYFSDDMPAIERIAAKIQGEIDREIANLKNQIVESNKGSVL